MPLFDILESLSKAPHHLHHIGLGATAAKLASRQSSHSNNTLRQDTAWQSFLSWIPGTGQYRTRVKLSSKSRIPLLYLASGLVLLLLLGVQFFTSRDVRPRPLQKPPPRSGNTLSPFGESVYRQEAYFEQLEPGTQCKPKSLFSAELPVTHALTNMALEAETKRMVAQFEYTTEDVNKGVKEFIREMEEGLEKEGATLSQIPTYVTSVPNGTEKVGHQAPWRFD